MSYQNSYRRTEESGRLRKTIYWVTDIVTVIMLAFFVVMFLCQRVTVTGHSMEGTLEAGEEVLVNQVKYHFFRPDRFDILVFEKENSVSDRTYMKRVIGLPGETIQIADEEILINGEPLQGEEGLGKVTLAGLAEKPIVLGEDEYFVLGDNRESSEDSRFSNIGNVKLSEIRGIVWMRVSPFAKLGKPSYVMPK